MGGPSSHQYYCIIYELCFQCVPLVVKILAGVLYPGQDVIGELKDFQKLLLRLGAVAIQFHERIGIVHGRAQCGEYEMHCL